MNTKLRLRLWPPLPRSAARSTSRYDPDRSSAVAPTTGSGSKHKYEFPRPYPEPCEEVTNTRRSAGLRAAATMSRTAARTLRTVPGPSYWGYGEVRAARLRTGLDTLQLRDVYGQNGQPIRTSQASETSNDLVSVVCVHAYRVPELPGIVPVDSSHGASQAVPALNRLDDFMGIPVPMFTGNTGIVNPKRHWVNWDRPGLGTRPGVGQRHPALDNPYQTANRVAQLTAVSLMGLLIAVSFYGGLIGMNGQSTFTTSEKLDPEAEEKRRKEFLATQDRERATLIRQLTPVGAGAVSKNRKPLSASALRPGWFWYCSCSRWPCWNPTRRTRCCAGNGDDRWSRKHVGMSQGVAHDTESHRNVGIRCRRHGAGP
jgi:hypothetical protein